MFLRISSEQIGPYSFFSSSRVTWQSEPMWLVQRLLALFHFPEVGFVQQSLVLPSFHRVPLLLFTFVTLDYNDLLQKRSMCCSISVNCRSTTLYSLLAFITNKNIRSWINGNRWSYRLVSKPEENLVPCFSERFFPGTGDLDRGPSLRHWTVDVGRRMRWVLERQPSSGGARHRRWWSQSQPECNTPCN